MATEKLKVFVNTTPSVSTSAITNVTLKATSSSEQAVLKTISYEAVDPEYPVTVSVTNGSAVLTTPKTTLKTVKNSDTLSGSQIVDVSSTVSIKFDTGPTLIPTGFQDARYFAGNNGVIYKWADSTTGARDSSVKLTYADTVGKFSSVINGSAYQKANSAFGIVLDANNTPTSSPAIAAGDKVYFAHYGNYTKAYNEAGALITWNTGGSNHSQWGWGTATYGTCTDGTYIYGVSNNSSTNLQRTTITGGDSSAILITMSSTVQGQAANQGGFTIYHDGFVYIHSVASNYDIVKINVTTGAVTTINSSTHDIGSYSTGAVLTRAHDGEFYIIEVGQTANKNVIIKLSDFTVSSISSASLNSSTEYGNLALEVAPGIALFFYNSNFIYIDVNDMSSGGNFNTTSYGVIDVSSNSDASSIANIPNHLNVLPSPARSVTHKVYADGVLIEGVE